MECVLGKTNQLKNFGVTLYQELLAIDADGAKMVQYFVIRPASNDWESKIYEFNPLFSFIKLLIEEDRNEALYTMLCNMQVMHTLPDMCYHHAVLLQSVYATDPGLLEEGYDNGIQSHAKMVEAEKELREIWISAHRRESEQYDKGKEVVSEDMDAGADITSQMF